MKGQNIIARIVAGLAVFMLFVAIAAAGFCIEDAPLVSVAALGYIFIFEKIFQN